ncbi:hemolysin family protein [bacterium]|nr:hemolysin family protein [bacterium]
MSTEEILLIVSLVLSAFFSGSETAYTAAGRLAMEVYSRHQRRGATVAKKLYSRPTLLFSTTLVGNNLAGVLYGSLAGLLMVRWGFSLEAILILSPMLVLLVGEVLPKTLAREHPERWAMMVGWPLYIIYFLLYPLIIVAQGASKLVLRLFGMKNDGDEPAAVTLGELRGLWGELYRSGELDEEEIELLDQVVSLREQKVHDVMTPRVDMVALPSGATIEEAEKLVHSRGMSRIPIYEESLDQIVGILLAKDLLDKPKDIQSIMRPPMFIPEQAFVAKFLGPFRRGQAGLAVVIDEHGGTAGVISLEDVIEQLVGNIEDEHDPREGIGKQVTSVSWLVPGRAYLDKVKQAWGIVLPQGDYDTVAGLILDRLERIPKVGETLEAGPWIIRIASADNRRIKRVLIRKAGPGRR